MSSFDEVVSDVGQVIDAVGVATIVVGAVIAAGATATRFRRGERDLYPQFREWLGRAILLGLELLVAADIIRTVAAKPTLTSVAVLAIIVAIRTFLSFSLQLEITGRRRRPRPDRAEPADADSG